MGYIVNMWYEIPEDRVIVHITGSAPDVENFKMYADGVFIGENTSSSGGAGQGVRWKIPPGAKMMCAVASSNQMCLDVSPYSGIKIPEPIPVPNGGTGTGNGGMGGLLLLFGIAATVIYLIGGKK